MIEGRNIICFANDWHGDPTSKHQIMLLLSRKNRVLWVSSIGLRKPGLGSRDAKRILSKLISFFKGAERIHSNLYIFTPVVIPFHRSRLFRGINALILKSALNHYIRKLGMRDVIYWSYLPNAGYIIKLMDSELIVYHCVDEWSKFSFIDDRIIYQERELCGMSDLVLTSAHSLYEARKGFNDETHYISHGVDYDYFHSAKSSNLPLPYDMEGIRGPIAGFFGLIHEWIDLDLLDHVISRNPSINFVFIGECSVDVQPLIAYKNAHFLGQKKYTDLLAYARHFDVGLIPFKVNELTVNVNPIKLKEYLALGIPVVSVDLPEISYYKETVRIAGDYPSFDQALKEELAGNHLASAKEIDNVARMETWEQKVDDISKLIALIEEKQGLDQY